MADHTLDSNYWSTRYKEKKTGWDRGTPSPFLLQWLESENTTPRRILVPGCGRGHEVVELCRRGFSVTAIDFSQHPIEHLKESLESEGLSATLVQSDVLQFEVEEPFDAIYEQTCLCAMNPKRWEEYEQCLARWLKPNGELLACFMQSPDHLNPPFDCDLTRMKKLFDGQRWAWPEKMQDISHPSKLVELAGILTRI